MRSNLTSTLTAEELAEKLKVTKKTIWKLTRQRRIPQFKVGRVARYDYADVKAALLKRPRGYTVAEVGKRMVVAGQFQDGWHWNGQRKSISLLIGCVQACMSTHPNASRVCAYASV